jgi:hypothetical protein
MIALNSCPLGRAQRNGIRCHPQCDAEFAARPSVGGQSFSSDVLGSDQSSGALAPEIPLSPFPHSSTSGPEGPRGARSMSDLKVRPPKRNRFRLPLRGQSFSSDVLGSDQSSGALAPEIPLSPFPYSSTSGPEGPRTACSMSDLKVRPPERNGSARRRIPPASPPRLHHAR